MQSTAPGRTEQAPTDPHALAAACAEAMLAADHCSQAHGIEIMEVGPGFARAMMSVREDMVNGHDLCHGAMLFLLADSTFAYACNSYNERSVAAGCAIEFLRPVRLGERLEALAEERYRRGRSGLYDVSVRREDGEIVALFRGKSTRIEGTFV